MRRGFICLLVGFVFSVPASAEMEKFYLGASYLNSDTEFRGYSDEDVGYGLRAGYSLTSHFAVEMNYFDFGTFHLPYLPDAGGKIDSDGISLQMVARYPIDRFTLYGKLGNLWWDREGVLGSVAGPVKFKDDGSDLIFGIGCSYELIPQLDINTEIEGSGSGYDSKLVSLGISYHF
jgi:hypothetical protein